MSLTFSTEEADALILERRLPPEATVKGTLTLRNLDLAGVTMPITVMGYLYLIGCNLTGVTLPTKITQDAHIYRGTLTGVTTWWTEGRGKHRRRCIAIDDYALIETEDGRYIAGYRGPWRAKRALEHWRARHRLDGRARRFAVAIPEAEERRASGN